MAIKEQADKITLELSKGNAAIVAEFIELNVFDFIRKDTEMDNIGWLCLMTDTYKTLMGLGNKTE